MECKTRCGYDKLLGFSKQDVRVFFMDEHRMGLQPIFKHKWLFPEEADQPVYFDCKWLWVYGFFSVNYGKSHLYLMPYLNRSHFQSTIDEFAKKRKISKVIQYCLFLTI